MAHGVAAAALVVAVVAVAYGTQAPTLGVAEFAPAAQKELTAPPTTAGETTSARGGGGRRATTTTAPSSASTRPSSSASSGSASTTRVGRARQCYGNPPRQAEDPLSPACLATTFEGDNGGATSTGVSTTEIRVAIPGMAATSAGTHGSSAINGLFEYFNQRFELYGRRLVPVFVPGSVLSPVGARAVGTETAAQGVFGALLGYADSGHALGNHAPQGALVHELARNGVVSVVQNRSTWWTDKLVFDPLHPYVWSVFPSGEELQRELAATGCALAAKPARHTTSSAIVGQTRKFGIVVSGNQVTPALGVLTQALEACDVAVAETVQGLHRGTFDTAVFAAGVEKLKAAAVTTVICVCEGLPEYPMIAAKAANYFPEWLHVGSNYWGGDEAWGQYQVAAGRSQPLSSIKVEAGPRIVPVQLRPWFGALLATFPKLAELSKSDLVSVFTVADFLYPQLLLLASGIQAAGPTLTPDTFGAGMMSSQFPNPSSGQAPDFLPSVGFGPGDHGFYDDFAVSWWSEATPAVEPFSPRPLGSWCSVGGGSRYRVNSVPADLDLHLYAPDPCR